MTEKSPRYGATLNEWATFDVLMGLTADLLPTVHHPKAVISPDSKMRDTGKVPSQYNRRGQVVGISEWTKKQADERDIARWTAKPDYGICLQTRTVRALDIDVPDHDTAVKIMAFITERVGVLPLRFRGNSNKFLLAFKVAGQMPKRVIKVREKVIDAAGKTTEPAWIIEFLATGQQFVVAGTHASGARIEWAWGDHEDFPTLTLEQFEMLWAALEKEFGVAPATMGGLRRRGESFESDDAAAQAIIDKGLMLDIGNDGQLFIECPWKDGHSMDSGITECAYFPRGSGGYDLGHFKCMHAGCAARKDEEFEDALGLRADMFDVVEPVLGEDEKPAPEAPPFERDKFGSPKANLYNLDLVLVRPDLIHCEIKYDVFRDEDMMRRPGGGWRRLSDGDVVKIRKHLERVLGFRPIARELIRDALTAHGDDYRFDSAIEWLNDEVPAWDGVKRIDNFMADYFGAEPGIYATAVGQYMWSALAGRILEPGVKADMAVILQGEQGVIKSTAIAALAPCEEQFGEISLGAKDDKLARMTRAKTVIELGELRGFYAKDFEDIKAWLVRRFDEWRPVYKERLIRYRRRCIFIGTTNHAEFLIDDTGNRRFLPLNVQRADIDRIRRDRLQLWAEARLLFLANGVAWKDAEDLAKDEHDKFTVSDSWGDDISKWLQLDDMGGVKPEAKPYLKMGDVLREALNIDARTANIGHEKRAGRVLRQLKYQSVRITVEGKKQRVWVKL